MQLAFLGVLVGAAFDIVRVSRKLLVSPVAFIFGYESVIISSSMLAVECFLVLCLSHRLRNIPLRGVTFSSNIIPSRLSCDNQNFLETRRGLRRETLRRADKQNRTTLCMGDYEVRVQGTIAVSMTRGGYM